ncbi:MAG: DUF58 domain-containing protein [Proteobacteria bacterium]|nr:MAG: DUF58 domain-containing protein [Pseudomonadota bacterium]
MRAGDGLVFSSLQSLLRLQSQVHTLNLAKRHAQARYVGQHRSVFKGRGMDFAESRLYQAGDDVRTIDWRVTARSGKVHTKVFQEEREKPVLVWIDLRASMFFATRGRFKTVLAAELASILAWKTLADGDRVGALLQLANGEHLEFKPTRSRSKVLEFLRALADATSNEPFMTAAPNKRSQRSLFESWQRLQRVTDVGTQVYVMSDFRAVDEQALQQLAMINRQSSLTLLSIRDPFEEHLPEQGHLQVTDGERSLWLNLKQRVWRERYQQRQQGMQTLLQDFSRKHRIPLINLSTQDSHISRLRKLSRGIAH